MDTGGAEADAGPDLSVLDANLLSLDVSRADVREDIEVPADVEVVRIDLDALPREDDVTPVDCVRPRERSRTTPFRGTTEAVSGNEDGDVLVGNDDHYVEYYGPDDASASEFGSIVQSEEYGRLVVLPRRAPGTVTFFRASGVVATLRPGEAERVDVPAGFGTRNLVAVSADLSVLHNVSSDDDTEVLQRCEPDGECEAIASLPDQPLWFAPTFSDASYVVWAGLSGIWRTHLWTGDTLALVRETTPRGFAADDRWIAWVTAGGDLFATEMGSDTVFLVDEDLRVPASPEEVERTTYANLFVQLQLRRGVLYWTTDGGTRAVELDRWVELTTRLADNVPKWFFATRCGFVVGNEETVDTIAR